eukprot:7705431-Pyramimonas_sp.AAC.1
MDGRGQGRVGRGGGGPPRSPQRRPRPPQGDLGYRRELEELEPTWLRRRERANGHHALNTLHTFTTRQALRRLTGQKAVWAHGACGALGHAAYLGVRLARWARRPFGALLRRAGHQGHSRQPGARLAFTRTEDS